MHAGQLSSLERRLAVHLRDTSGKGLLWGAVSSPEAGEDLLSLSVDVLCTLWSLPSQQL